MRALPKGADSEQDDDAPVPTYTPRTPQDGRWPTSIRHKFKVFDSASGRPQGGGSASSREGYGSGSAGKSSARSTISAKARDRSRGEKQQGVARAEEAAVDTKEAPLAVVGRPGNSSRPTSSRKGGRVRGPDTAGGSGGGGSAGGGSGGSSGSLAKLNTPGLTSSEERDLRRRAFVKQYSGASTYDGDSDYSMHDNNAPTTPARAKSGLTSQQGNQTPLASARSNSGLTSFHGSDVDVGDRRSIDPPARRAVGPVSTIDLGYASTDPLAVTVEKISVKRGSPTRPSAFDNRARMRAISVAVKNISEAGSGHEDGNDS